jgi:hypothetical protein
MFIGKNNTTLNSCIHRNIKTPLSPFYYEVILMEEHPGQVSYPTSIFYRKYFLPSSVAIKNGVMECGEMGL